MLDKLQRHTIDIYQLKNKQFEVINVPAQSLLDPSRFDLFAKLAYVRLRNENRAQAEYIYDAHIKAFNPDLKEPGRNDKNSLDDFRNTFDSLIDTFEKESFDSSKSVIPLAENNVILDGAHRVAALAFFDKKVDCLKFKNVLPKAPFDYLYFINRGLPWDVADLMALEMCSWLPNLYVACLWPRIADKSLALSALKNRFCIAYEKQVNVSLKSLMNFVGKIYEVQDWTKNKEAVADKAMRCYGPKKKIHFVFFTANSLDDVIVAKEDIRNEYGVEKHALHITDSKDETKLIAQMVLSPEIRQTWCVDETALSRIKSRIAEKWLYFRKIHWINFKVFVAKLIRYKK